MIFTTLTRPLALGNLRFCSRIMLAIHPHMHRYPGYPCLHHCNLQHELIWIEQSWMLMVVIFQKKLESSHMVHALWEVGYPLKCKPIRCNQKNMKVNWRVIDLKGVLTVMSPFQLKNKSGLRNTCSWPLALNLISLRSKLIQLIIPPTSN